MPLSVVKDYALLSKSDALYERASDFMLSHLAESGLEPHDLRSKPVVLRQSGALGYLIPYQDSDYWRIRFDPRSVNVLLRGKYRGPAKVRGIPYMPYGITRPQYRNAHVKYICEGEKKAVAFFKRFKVPVIAIGGKDMWAAPSIPGETKEVSKELAALLHREQRLIYIADRDVIKYTNLSIGRSACELKRAMEKLGIQCTVTFPPDDDTKGIDDWLVAHPDEDDINVIGLWSEFLGIQIPPLELRQDFGVTFNDPSEHSMLSYRHIVHDTNNTEILGSLVLKGIENELSFDHYRGLMWEDLELDDDIAALKLEAEVNHYFPKAKLKEGGIKLAWRSWIDTIQESNCVKEHMLSVQWDGTSRLDSLATDIMELQPEMPPPLANQMLLQAVCGMYARIMWPGCKFDHMLILAGAQKIGKTYFLQELGQYPNLNGTITGGPRKLLDVSRDGAVLRRKAVVLLFDELGNPSRYDLQQLKRAVTERSETIRTLYTQRSQEIQYGYLMAGTSNSRTFFQDETGNRRFLAVDVKRFKPQMKMSDWVSAWRDQVMAEIAMKWDTLKDKWYDLVDDEAVNMHAATHMMHNPVALAIRDMLMDEKTFGYQGRQWTTIASIQSLLDMGNENLSATRIGHMFKQLRHQDYCPVIVGHPMRVRTRQLEGYGAKGNKPDEMVNAYPVELNPKFKDVL